MILGILSDVADVDGLRQDSQTNVFGEELKNASIQNSQSRIVSQNIERFFDILDFVYLSVGILNKFLNHS